MAWPTSVSQILPSSMSLEMVFACSHMSELVDLAQILALAGEGELATQMPMGVLINDAADIVWIVTGEHAVDDHLRDRHLSAQRLAARFEIDGIGQALLRLGALLAFKAETNRRRYQRPRIVLAGDALTAQPRFGGASSAESLISGSRPREAKTGSAPSGHCSRPLRAPMTPPPK